MIDQSVQNLAIGVLGCMGYDALKTNVLITAAMVKNKLRAWLDINEKDSQTIANAMNSAPDAYRTNDEIFKAFIKTNKDIIQSLSNAKVINNNSINGGTFNNSFVNQGSSIQDQTIDNGNVSEAVKKT